VFTLFSTMSSCKRRVAPFKFFVSGRKKNSNRREEGVFPIGSGIYEAVCARTVGEFIRVRMRRLGESEAGPYATASEAEWVPLFIRFGHGCKWTQQVQRLGARQCSIIFNSSRCGHVNIIIDPSAFKESVAASGLVFPVWQKILSGV
jgi:hypothetical protein